MKTIIMAGGRGSRIAELFPDIPKPLIPIENSEGVSRSVLEWEIRSLVKQGFKDIIITVSYLSEKIMNHFGNGESLGAKIEYFVEEIPLGNAGALFKIRDKLTEPFLLLNADTMFDIDFNRFVAWHYSHDGALVSLFTHPNSHPKDSGLIIADEDKSVIAWLTKEEARPKWFKNCVNAGLQVIDPVVLDMTGIDPITIGTIDENGKIKKVDLDRQVLKPLCGKRLMFAYDSPEYVKDMGTPERYEQVALDYRSGVIQHKNLQKKQKAIFMDRDGTINKYVGFLRDIDQFELLPGVTDAIRLINTSGYLAIVITNQPVIARGEINVEELKHIHNKMETLLANEGVYLDGLYYCPHHPDKGFEGEVKELKIECSCRKPKPGMIFKAAKDLNIDLSKSWMIGDGSNDILCGQAAGCNTILLTAEGTDFGADLVKRNLLLAVKSILSGQ